jgi:ADP-dependent phosphofructokinase/glucokinase
MLNRDQCRTVASFYKTDIETGNPRYFSFIASSKHFEASNLCAPQIIAYFLCELREWLSEMSKDKLKRLSDFSKQKNFVIAINFANGMIPKWHSQGMSSSEIARHLKVPNYHNLISDSLSASDKSGKSIYRNHTLMRTTIEYCEFYGLHVTRDFRKRLKERKAKLSARH